MSRTKRRKVSRGGTGSKVETVEEYFTALVGQQWKKNKFLSWPPDAFFLAASLLHRTGAYIRLVREWPPRGKRGRKVENWSNTMARRGENWCYYANRLMEKKYQRELKERQHWEDIELDPAIIGSWGKIVANGSLLIADLIKKRNKNEHEDFWTAIFETVAAADEACAGIGVAVSRKFKNDKASGSDRLNYILHYAMAKLYYDAAGGRSATLCTETPAFLGSVLPKMHTPQSGITLRSMTHNLAYLRPTEVSVAFTTMLSTAGFLGDDTKELGHSINVLLIPWPNEVKPNDFCSVQCPKQSVTSKFGFFTFSPKRPALAKRARAVAKMLEQAEALVGKVDGVLMPELSLGQEEFDQIAATVQKKMPYAFLIAGVGTSSTRRKCGTNKAVFSPARFNKPIEQAKHHRWQLEHSQIEQYGLGSKLDPSRTWWEHIPIDGREINFANLSERVTLTMLICEDLARQDPIADVIRSIGPNLVIALLMDGPQISGRWPAHYASVFADDPGSSVLTVTSIGMSHLCRPKGHPVRRVVGLWRDRLDGVREIELPENASGLVLTLTLDDREEWTADGRSDHHQSTYLTLNGIHPIFPGIETSH
jgi:hypothetical protein